MKNEDIIAAYRDRRRAEAELAKAREQAAANGREYDRQREALSLASIVTDVHKGIALRVDGEHVMRLDDNSRSAQVCALVGSRKGVYLVIVRNNRREEQREFTSRDAAYAYAKDAITR